MKLLENILTKLFDSKPLKSVVDSRAYDQNQSRIKEQLMPEFAGSTGMFIDPDEDKFRRVSQTNRDKDPLTYERSINISHWMYGRNGFYKRMIDISLQAIASAGMNIETEDEIIQEAWHAFWDDPTTGISGWFYQDMVDVNLSGEANWPLAINPINGDLEIGYIDPLNVKAIKMLPGNVRVPDKLFMKDKLLDAPESGKIFEILKIMFGFWVGDLIHFPINKPLNASRGTPALMALIDHVDLYDQVFFNEGERMLMKKLFIWDVTRNGSTDEKNEKWLAKNFPNGQPPKASSVRVHNEEEIWNEVSPQLDSSDSSEGIRTIRQGIAGAGGFPDFFFGWGGDTNVATAREMADPTMWMIEWQQKGIIKFLTKLFSYQLQSWDSKKHLDSGLVKSTGVKWEIKANNVFPKGFVVQAAAFGQVINSLVVAKNGGLIDDDTAIKMAVDSSNELGFNISVNEIKEGFETQEKDKDMFGSEIVPNKKDEKKPELSNLSFEQIMKMSKRTVSDNGHK